MTASGQARADAVSDLLNLKRRGIDRLAQRWQDRLTLNGGDEYTPTQQSNADAMADAETLREFQRDPYIPNILLRTFAPGAIHVPVGALRCGADLEMWQRGHFYETEAILVDDATWAAHFAFLAVPGLRGEDKSEYKRAD